MSRRIVGVSHAFCEFLLLPNLTARDCTSDTVDLRTPLVRYRAAAEAPALSLGIPLASAMMQSVTDHRMAIALARLGGIGFIFGSQSPERQAEMVAAAKDAKTTEPAAEVGHRGVRPLVDADGRLVVGAAVNTTDYRDRIPVLISAGADVLCLDSSDGYSEFERDALDFVRQTYGGAVRVGAGNVVHADGFRYLADAGADFVKVGIGGGAISITREQKGVGCGQATAVMTVAEERDRYQAETGSYLPICSDGGISQDYHIALALAMGADFVMMGRYFARFDESPGKIIKFNLSYAKEYWGEGTGRAIAVSTLGRERAFEEGVDAYVPYAGGLTDNVNSTLSKLRSVMCNCGSRSLSEFRDSAHFVQVSPGAMREGSTHDVIMKRTDTTG